MTTGMDMVTLVTYRKVQMFRTLASRWNKERLDDFEAEI